MPSLEQLRKLLAADPGDAFVLYAIAQEHARLREHESAISFYDRAMGVTPDDGYIYFHKARSLGELGRTHEQARVLKQGIEAAARAGDAKAAGELRAALEDLE
ncbi:MAG: hypothetical protein U0573_07595 [Phycisphaerales bacterium]|nr:tetratricopeptide repeat protein [Planctomycetota bacterium]